MTANREFQRFIDKCKNEIDTFFDIAYSSLCKSEEERSEAFQSFSITMHKGIAFRTSKQSSNASLKMAARIVDVLGTDQASIKEIRKTGYTSLADLLVEKDNWKNEDLLLEFRRRIFEDIGTKFDFTSPCEIFDFVGIEPHIDCGIVKIATSEKFLEQANIPKSGKDWTISASPDPWPRMLQKSNFQKFEVYGNVWWIKCNGPKDLAPQSARWIAEVFISLLRLSVRQADYCHRARIGEREPEPFSEARAFNRHIVFNDKSFTYGSYLLEKRYKIDKEVLEEIHQPKFQEKVCHTLAPERNTLGERVAHGLGWLTRSRQSADDSVRLLYCFTALEALLSEKSAFSPVADSIARMTSVILSNDPSHREETYFEIRELYNLRSDLIHQGRRDIHWLNANNIQYIAELAFSIVLRNSDLQNRHQNFLKSLKDATHGGEWPN